MQNICEEFWKGCIFKCKYTLTYVCLILSLSILSPIILVITKGRNSYTLQQTLVMSFQESIMDPMPLHLPLCTCLKNWRMHDGKICHMKISYPLVFMAYFSCISETELTCSDFGLILKLLLILGWYLRGTFLYFNV